MSALTTYFQGERAAGWFLLALGVCGAGFGLWLHRGGGALRAMLWPMALVGALQVAVGLGLALKTPGQVATLEASLSAEPAAARTQERTRMEAVMGRFRTIVWVEIGVVLLGLALALQHGRPSWQGLGAGLVIQGGVMLAFDLFAQQRGVQYLAWLRAG